MGKLSDLSMGELKEQVHIIVMGNYMQYTFYKNIKE